MYYWYGEHKVYGKAGNRAHVGVHVYASKNLYDWEDLGVALAVEDDPKSLICDGCVGHAAAVLHTHGKGNQQNGKNYDEGNDPFQTLHDETPFVFGKDSIAR